MPSSARAVVELVYAKFAEGDFAGFLSLCSEDIEWVVNGPSELDKCRAFQGPAGVQRFLDILGETWAFSSFEVKQYIVDGETVVVLGCETGSSKATGVPHENRWVHVFDVREGRVSRFREFLCHWPGQPGPPPMSW